MDYEPLVSLNKALSGPYFSGGGQLWGGYLRFPWLLEGLISMSFFFPFFRSKYFSHLGSSSRPVGPRPWQPSVGENYGMDVFPKMVGFFPPNHPFKNRVFQLN